jgi:tRNA pseudouridine55 synthase
MPSSVVHNGPVVRDAVLNVKKDAGWTSHDVVAKVRGCLRGVRIGHAGTLDPAAVGVLPLLLGRATRLAEYLLDWDKEYVAVLKLGETTDTLDATGTVLARRPIEQLTADAIRSTIERFRGYVRQVPPMYSAVKVAGVPLYKAARAGRTVPREPREILIQNIEVLGIAGPTVSLRVTCSKGTYIRTLCSDIGEALGVGAHLTALERTRVGPLCLDAAMSVGELCEWFVHGDRTDAHPPQFLSLDQALHSLPTVTVTAAAAVRAVHGVAVPATAILKDQTTAQFGTRQAVRLKDPEGRLLGLGTLPEVSIDQQPTAMIQIAKVLSDPTQNSG